MKLTDNPVSDKTEIHALKQFEKKTIFLGSKTLRPGHRCFEINTISLSCVEAKYETDVNYNRPNTRKVMQKENCVYVNALNAKNALKVYRRDCL